MKKNKSQIFKRLFDFYKGYKKYFIVLMLLLFIGFFFAIGGPIILTKVIAQITNAEYNSALIFSVFYLASRIGIDIFHGSYELINRRLGKKFELEMRDELVKSINNCTTAQLDETDSGALLSRINTDSSNLYSSIIESTSSIACIVSALGYLIYMAFINWIFFIFYVVMAIIVIILDFTRIKYQYNKQKKIQADYDKSSSLYNEIVRGYRDIKCLNIKDDIQKLSHDKMERTLEMQTKMKVKIVWMERGKNVLTRFAFFLVFLMGIFFLQNNTIDLATFVIVYTYFDRIQVLSNYIQNLKQGLTNTKFHAERLFDVIDNYPKETFGTQIINESKGKIEVKNLTFGYTQKQLLNNVNVTFEPNKMTAIVGKSGCGKTTILNLLNYLYTDYTGEILIDGQNIRTLSENTIRNTIGIVNQSPYLYNLTIRENLLLVKSNATDAEIWSVLERVSLKEYILSLDQQLDSIIGENGVTLSGGQRQRLAIARTLLKNTKIIVFDEATSALDNTTQQSIVNDIAFLKEQHTIIVIAHRLSTIKTADKIYVLEKGRVVGEGSHTQLIETNKIYKSLYNEE